jgi:hypothetical protein
MSATEFLLLRSSQTQCICCNVQIEQVMAAVGTQRADRVAAPYRQISTQDGIALWCVAR